MTKEQFDTFKIGDEVGFYGLRCRVVKLYTTADDYGIIISQPQKENEIKGKTRNKEYLITDIKAVLKL